MKTLKKLNFYPCLYPSNSYYSNEISMLNLMEKACPCGVHSEAGITFMYTVLAPPTLLYTKEKYYPIISRIC